MFDLFGLKKDPAAPEPAESAASETPGPGSAKLWFAALVVDAVFVMVFGGAVSAKVYQHWKAPGAPAAPTRPAKKPKAIEPPKAPPQPPAPAPAPAATPEAVKTPEPPKAAATPPAGPSGTRLSLHTEAPKPRQAPQPVSTPGKPAAPAAAAAPSGAAKATPYEFRFKAAGAKTVELGGAFIVRNNGRKNMVRHPDGLWTLTLYLTPNTYRYFFLVDGKKTIDPSNPKTERGASVMVLQP